MIKKVIQIIVVLSLSSIIVAATARPSTDY